MARAWVELQREPDGSWLRSAEGADGGGAALLPLRDRPRLQIAEGEAAAISAEEWESRQSEAAGAAAEEQQGQEQQQQPDAKAQAAAMRAALEAARREIGAPAGAGEEEGGAAAGPRRPAQGMGGQTRVVVVQRRPEIEAVRQGARDLFVCPSSLLALSALLLHRAARAQPAAFG